MSLTINSRLCIAPIGRPPVIRVGQYDSNFEIEFEMYTIEPITWDLEEGTTAMIRGTKTDKRGYSADCDIDIPNKKVTVYGDIQMTAAAGPCVYEIVLKKNDKEISSINFTLQVERAALDADTIPSESKIKEIQDIGQKADAIIEAYENLQFDSTPTAGSTKAVTSGGIKTYVDDATTTDTTLSETGKPADAEAVGDALDGKVDEPGTAGTAGQFLQKGTNGNQWVDVETDVDATLTQEGVPADAKAVGDEVTDLKSAVYESDYLLITDVTTVSGLYIKTDGKIGKDNSLNVYVLPCAYNRKYYLEASNTSVLRYGTVTTLSNVAENKTLNDFVNSAELNKFITPSYGSNYIVIYVGTGTFNFHEVLEYHDRQTINENNININNSLSHDCNKTSFLNIDIENECTLISNLRIAEDGSLESASSRTVAYFSCEPNTYYKIMKNSSDGYASAIGYTSTNPSNIVAGLKLDNFSFGGEQEHFILTSDSATYIVFSVRTSDFYSNINLLEETEKYSIEIPMEGGGWNSSVGYDNDRDHFKARRRSAFFVDIHGAKQIKVVDTTNYTHTWIIVTCYSSNYSYLGYLEKNAQNPIFIIPDNTDRIKIEIYTQEKIKIISIETYGSIKRPKLSKNILLDNTTPAKILYSLTGNNFTTSRLMLPPNYTTDGTPVPLILWMDGTSNFPNWDSAMSSEKMTYLEYLRDEGFAVFSVFAMGYNYYYSYPDCGKNYPFVIPTNIEAITKGIEYVLDRFNIDPDNVNIMSKSQGGQCATYFASNPTFKIRSIGMFSPVVDYLSMPGGNPIYADVRNVIADDLNLGGEYISYFRSGEFLTHSTEGRAFWAENKTALCQLNEAWTNLTEGTLDEHLQSSLDDGQAFWDDEYWNDPTLDSIYTNTNYHKIGKVPVKIWGASDDNQTPYLAMVQLVSQLQNAGCEAVMRTLNRNTGGHSCADMFNKIASVTTSLGITYTELPIGWYENVLWIRQHSWK